MSPVTFFGFFNLGVTLRGTSTMRMESVRNTDPVEFTDAATRRREHRSPMLTPRDSQRRARRRPRALGDPDPASSSCSSLWLVDVGTWYTHKRQLQNRADAGALAAGVEYGTRFGVMRHPATKAAAEAAIARAARRYGGDPSRQGRCATPRSPRQARVNVEINAPALAGAVDQDTSWNDARRGRRTRPVRPHPADAISPNRTRIWTQVGVRERNQRSLFGMFGVDLLNNRAHARVELQPALAGKGFIPVAVPDQDIRQAQMRYYRECGPGAPALLATVPLRAAERDIRRSAERRCGARPSATSRAASLPA